MRAYRAITAFAILCASRGIAAAQRSDAASVVAATLTYTVELLGDADPGADLAFDPRIVLAGREPGRDASAETTVPVWIGNRRDTVFAASTVETILRSAAPAETWVTCDPESPARACNSTAFSLVAAVSEPWIEGDHAQLIVFVNYRSKIKAHPQAIIVNLVQLEKVEGCWRVRRVFNQVTT